MVAVPINPKVLEWARTERRITVAVAAKKLRISEDEVRRLEAGDGAVPVPVSLLRKMATKYRINFGALLMPSPLPPATRPQIQDFRTHDGGTPEIEHKLIAEIEDVYQQMQTLADVKAAAPNLFEAPILPRDALSLKAEELAASERKRLGVSADEQFGWLSASHAFRRWRATIERQGIFVYLINLGPTTNCRGVTLLHGDGIAVALINSFEKNGAARTFSLLHEYAHILRREAAISDENRQDTRERFCNQFAAYFLMPRATFVTEANRIRPESNRWSDFHVARLAKRFWVSKQAVAIHLEELGLAEIGFHDRMLAEWERRNKKQSKGGPETSHEERRVIRWGARHVRTVLDALDNGHLNKVEAYHLLGVRPNSFGQLRKEADAQQAAYGGAG